MNREIGNIVIKRIWYTYYNDAHLEGIRPTGYLNLRPKNVSFIIHTKKYNVSKIV